jgi:hypothetical protein
MAVASFIMANRPEDCHSEKMIQTGLPEVCNHAFAMTPAQPASPVLFSHSWQTDGTNVMLGTSGPAESVLH